jgi:hypothetical protein
VEAAGLAEAEAAPAALAGALAGLAGVLAGLDAGLLTLAVPPQAASTAASPPAPDSQMNFRRLNVDCICRFTSS